MYRSEELDTVLTEEDKTQIENGAEELITQALRAVTTESALRALSASWGTQAEEYKQSAETLMSILTNEDIYREDDRFIEPLNNWVKYKMMTRAVELLGIPPADEELPSGRLPGESAYDYIKRTEKLR